MSTRRDNKSVRINDATWLRLLQFLATLTKSELQEFDSESRELPGRLTMNDAITVLLNRQDAHRNRSQKSNEKRKTPKVDSVDSGDNSSERV